MGVKRPKVGIFGKKSIYRALDTQKSRFFDPIPWIIGI
jgi:hypothetical protein